jgi:hypothetical protein
MESTECDWFEDQNQCEQDYFQNENEPIRVHSPQNNVRCSSTPVQCEPEQTGNNAVDQLIDDFTMVDSDDLDQFYSQDFDSLFSLNV